MENILLAIKYVEIIGAELFVLGMTGATLIAFVVCFIRHWTEQTADSVQKTPSPVVRKSH